MAEALETHSDVAASVTEPEVAPKVDTTITCKEDSTADVSMETVNSDTCNDKPNNSDKKEYTNEQRLKRRAYFDKRNKSRKLAKEKYRKDFVKRLVNSPMRPVTSSRGVKLTKNILSANMSEEDKKMLDFYKVRLSTLRIENEALHKRLHYLVNENMRFLQMGPPKNS